MKSNAVARAAVLTVSAALALSACTSDNGADGGGGSGGSGDGTNDTLRLPLSQQPGDLRVSHFFGGEGYIFSSIHDSLVDIAPDGSVEPGLAESWTQNDDATQLTFSIRAGEEFTDGTPVDAEAVVTSLQASRQAPATSALFEAVTDIAATDDATVVVTLSAPDAALLTSLGGIAGAVGSPASIDDPDAQNDPVGSGPYTLDTDNTVVGSSYTLVKNDDNWNAEAYPYETVVLTYFADTTASQNALRSGQIDAAGMGAEQAAGFDPGQFTVETSAAQAVLGFWLADREGQVVPALADVRVRQAINMALDREGITEALLAGTLNPTAQVFDPRGQAYDEALDELYPYDVDAARDLMSEAGYADGFSVTMPSTPITQQFESVVGQQLGDIGIDVTWEAVALTEAPARLAARTYGMYLFFSGYAGSDAGDAAANVSGVFNPWELEDPELDQLIATANSAPSDEQGEAFRAVNEYMTEQAFFAPVAYATAKIVLTKDVEFTQPYVASADVRPYQPAGSN